MPNLYDLAYATGLAVGAPYWLIKSSARTKVLSALRERLGRNLPARGEGCAILIHAVSVGEINSTPALIREMRSQKPDLSFIVSTTTQTGFERSRQLYKDSTDVTLIRFPLDFTSAIARVLDRLRPSMVVLMELEVWPNFMRQCARRKIPVIVAAGRITEPAFRRYRRGGPITRTMFGRLAAVAAQDQLFADRFAALGVARERISILGTMKFDSATIADRIDGDEELARAIGIRFGQEPIWLAGSTGPGEEQIVLDVYRKILSHQPNLRLVIVPRHPPRFDEVANLITSAGFDCFRRSTSTLIRAASNHQPPTSSPIILGDTMGELRKFYSIATVVFVGRSMVDLGPRQHGSDMIEPAALAKATIVGPYTGNFDMPVRLLKQSSAIVEVTDAAGLYSALDALLRDSHRRNSMGRSAQSVVRSATGATRRHADLAMGFLV